MSAPQEPLRLLLVHAHPDDESINNGATMAAAVASGVRVSLVTCTRGELGEVIPTELRHLDASHEDRLGAHRERELAAAMRALGVRDHVFLDVCAPHLGPAYYRDSGMAYAADGRVVPVPDPAATAFASAPVDEPAARLAAVLRDRRPHVLVGYDPGGGYGHPDHVMAHQVSMRAVELAAVDERRAGGRPGWAVPKVYWTVQPASAYDRALADVRGPDNPFRPHPAGAPVPSMVVPDDQVTTRVDAQDQLPAKAAAMRAHATQVTVREPYYCLSHEVGARLSGVEHYRLVRGRLGPERDAEGYEPSLFGGLAGSRVE